MELKVIRDFSHLLKKSSDPVPYDDSDEERKDKVLSIRKISSVKRALHQITHLKKLKLAQTPSDCEIEIST